MREADTRNSIPAEQHAKGFRSLRFQASLESQFQRSYNEASTLRLRIAALVAVALFALFGIYHYFLYPTPIAFFIAGIELLVICPLLLLLFWATFWPAFKHDTAPLFLTALFIAVAGLLASMLTAHSHGLAYRYDGLMLITLYVYFLSGMRFRLATSAGLVVFASYALGDALTPLPMQRWLENCFYLLSVNVIGIAGCYALEYSVRQSFLNTLQLKDQAQRDGLTGLHNRRYLEEQLPILWRQARREGHRIGAAFFDVDFFKAYNDTHGHLEGDDCLREVAQALREEARRPLDMVVRYGGEEFLVVWYGLDSADILHNLADRVRMRAKELRIPHHASMVANHVTISGGAAATIPGGHDGIEAFLACADAALYQAKMAGRDRITVVPEWTGQRSPELPKQPEESAAGNETAADQWVAQYRSKDTSVYRLIYQMLVLTRYRKPLFEPQVAVMLRQVIRAVCSEHDINILKGRVNPDRMELIIEAPPALAADEILNIIKAQTLSILAEEFPKLLNGAADPQLWEPGYFVATLGELDSRAVDNYINHNSSGQEVHDDFQIADAG